MVTLDVVREAADGACTVHWKDPLDGRMRDEAFTCDPDRDPILRGSYDTAREVASGPWKGDLYPLDARYGTPALLFDQAVGLCGLIGLALLGAGAVTGSVHLARRWASRGAAFPFAAGPARRGARPAGHPGHGAAGISAIVGLAGMALSALVLFAELPEAMERASAFRAALPCAGAVADAPQDCTRPVPFTVVSTEIKESGRNRTYKANLSGSRYWDGEVSFGDDEPVLAGLRPGDRVTGTVWRGDVVAVAAAGERQATGADPADEPAGNVVLGIVLGIVGVLGLLYAASCLTTGDGAGRPASVGDLWVSRTAWLTSALVAAAFLLRWGEVPFWCSAVCGGLAVLSPVHRVARDRWTAGR
ncbi:hypothetical protein ACGFS9_16645 [Streptomyces sp. NPDC048566]|uniref:hypothetical protein n=1 Tax=Streptomyces sp. NPDC048566 TaxID=3365569 RepID=UPI00371993EE